MTTTLLDRLVEPVTECLTEAAARKLVALRADPALQDRVDELADKSNAGTLTDEERTEYDRYLAAFHLVTMIQVEARKRLGQVAN